MTTDAARMLSDVRALTGQVRRDQRRTWVALSVLAAATLVAIPFDLLFMWVRCDDTGCMFGRQGLFYYWPAALLIAYAVIAVSYIRAARDRGVGTRVLPYAITGAVTAVVITAVSLAAAAWFPDNPPFDGGPMPYWWIVLDRLVLPWGLIGLALLVLARLERHLALFWFTVGYLVLVLLVVPTNEGIHVPFVTDPALQLRLSTVLPQLIVAAALLAGAIGFHRARPGQR
ncbi:hypothetical protein KOI35_22065 [Actinoplanes bogorensis]|uniref:Integral membrane protein n=1 Tax=Paractinoplanes bogorensis TaxID=1610840 RepID=A0ABS5YRW7_9ACTN|nr:hypothetical protein [Actinoplanes bogorensis]MBU2666190.1 hypothetical protein [Actinoplanes bogorensis]